MASPAMAGPLYFDGICLFGRGLFFSSSSHDQSLTDMCICLFRLPEDVKGGNYKYKIKKLISVLITVDAKGLSFGVSVHQ